MTEDKNTIEEKEVEKAAAPEPVEAAPEKLVSLRDEVIDIKPMKLNSNVQDELPDNIKKLLEKKKTEKTDKKKKNRKKKVEKKFTVGKAFIKATYNNTIVTLTNLNGDVVSWASAGVAGFKGPKKSTPYAAQIITRIAVERAKEHGLQEVGVYVKGVGTGRESAIRALNASGLNVTYIKDHTPLPHNGCRPKKQRRV